MGGEGIRVTKPEEVGPALTSLINSGKPGVLEIVVSQVDITDRHTTLYRSYTICEYSEGLGLTFVIL